MILRLLVVVTLLVAGMPRGSALANGGHIHIYGTFGVPLALAWVLGGTAAFIFLWLIILWAISYRRLQRRRGTTGIPGEEGNNGIIDE